MMDDLVTWLRAQLDEDEWVASLITCGGYQPARWTSHRVLDGEWAEIRQHELPIGASDDEQPEVSTAGLMVWGRNEDQHIVRWSPKRVVDEVAAKRRIIDLHYPVDPCDAHDAGLQSVACDTVRLLALPYADRPGYREEWKP